MVRTIAFLLLSTALPAAAIEVRGRVLAPGGGPAAKIAVELLSFTGESLGRATTDAQGAFRLDAEEEGMVRVAVRAPDAIPVEARLLPLLDDVELEPLRLEKRETLRLHAPPGTRVAARPARPRTHDGWTDADRGGTTDEHGVLFVPRRAGETIEVVTAMARARAGSGADLMLRDEKPCARQLVVRDAGGATVPEARVLTESVLLGTTDANGAVTVTAACGRELAIETGDGRRARVPPAPAGEITLAGERWTGRVLDAGSRTPVANAFVWSDDDPAGFVRTDAKGTYSMTRAPSRAAAAGHLPSAAGPTFALQPVVAIAGTVVDGEGRAVSGAELRLREAGADRNRPWPEGLPSRATSGGRGGFRFAALPHRAYTIEASHDGFAPSVVTVKDHGSAVEIVLAAGQSAFGRVTDESANPIAGAEVRLTPASDAPRFLRGKPEEEEVRVALADGEGNFRFEHLPRGTFEVEAEAEGFAPATARTVTIEVDRAADLGVVTLERGVTLEGVVVDAEDRPVAGATVVAYPPSPAGIRGEAISRIAAAMGDAREALSRADGSFRITGLRDEAAVDVTARKAGHVAVTLAQLELPHREPLRLVLESGARVAGRVASEQGEGVAGAVVTVRPADSPLPAGLSGQTVTTDAAGAFTLGEMPPGRFALEAAAKGYVAADARVVEVRAGENLDAVELTLRRGAAIRGVVLTPDGAPAAGARVTVRGKSTPDRLLQIELAGNARTDGDGRYRLDGVSPGPQTVVAVSEGYASAMHEVTVQPGSNRVDLRLGEGVALAGRVVDGAGNPVAGATIAAGPPPRGEVSDAGGAFRFTGLESGTYTVTARKDGYAMARREVQLSGRPVEDFELRLEHGGGVITGRVSGLPPTLLGQIDVRAMAVPLASMDGLREGRTDAQGTYRVEGVHAGKWEVAARHASGREVRKQVTVAEGGRTTQLDLEFGGGLTLTGTVRHLGEPVAGATVQAGSATASTDASGFFRITGIEAGEHTVVVTVATTGARHSQQVMITGDRQLDIDL